VLLPASSMCFQSDETASVCDGLLDPPFGRTNVTAIENVCRLLVIQHETK
jgi:hypothetical protein